MLVESRGHVPFAARATQGRRGWARVVLVQTVAGPLTDDRWRIEVEIGPRAALELVGNAATIAYPCTKPARHDVRLQLRPDARLAWLPEPLILASGCNLDASLELGLAAGAAAYTREMVLLGRHGEQPGNYRSNTRCELDRTPLLHDTVELAADGVGCCSAAILCGARAFASLALLGLEPDSRTDPGQLALARHGAVLRVLGTDAASVHARTAQTERHYLERLTRSCHDSDPARSLDSG